MGLPGYVGLAFISSFTTTDVGAVITRDLYDEGKLTDDERTIFVAYQYAASGTLANTINCGAPLMPISLLSFGIIFMVEIIVKIIGANIIRVYLAMKRKKAVGGANLWQHRLKIKQFWKNLWWAAKKVFTLALKILCLLWCWHML